MEWNLRLIDLIMHNNIEFHLKRNDHVFNEQHTATEINQDMWVYSFKDCITDLIMHVTNGMKLLQTTEVIESKIV